jgi:hypothetical protein
MSLYSERSSKARLGILVFGSWRSSQLSECALTGVIVINLSFDLHLVL